MVMTDPIADMLTRIRNGIQVRRRYVDVPSSRIKSGIALVLKEEGYIENVEAREDERGFGLLRIHLRYDQDGRSAITELKRTSKPGCRVYTSSREVPEVRRGLGVAILSTPKGVMSGRKAAAEKVGGEVLCTVF